MTKLFAPQNDQRRLGATLEFAGVHESKIAAFLPNPLVINGLVGQIVGLLLARNPG